MKKWLLFDCMETIVDFYPLPTRDDYFDMGFLDSQLSKEVDRDLVLNHYIDSITYFKGIYQETDEYPMSLRYDYVVEKLGYQKALADEMSERFFEVYKTRCHVKDEKRKILEELSKNYQLGVISDFKVKGGIEDLLDEFKLSQYFDFIITSIGVGKRKPDPIIYQKALDICLCDKSDVVYIGDNYERDYLGAKGFGIDGIFYNPSGIQKIGDSIMRFEELLERFLE